MRRPASPQTSLRSALKAPGTSRRTAANPGQREGSQQLHAHLRDTTRHTETVMSQASATHATQLSSHSLRARTRRPKAKSYVALTPKRNQARHSDTSLQLSAPLRTHPPLKAFNKSYVSSVAGDQQ